MAVVVFFYVQGKENRQPAAVSGGSVSAYAVKSIPENEEMAQVTESAVESNTATPKTAVTPKKNKSDTEKRATEKRATATPKSKTGKSPTATPGRAAKKKATATPKTADDFVGDLDDLSE